MRTVIWGYTAAHPLTTGILLWIVLALIALAIWMLCKPRSDEDAIQIVHRSEHIWTPDGDYSQRSVSTPAVKGFDRKVARR